MKLSEMILHVGDENVTIQNLASDMTQFTSGKKDSKITFCTSKENGQQLARHAATGKKPDMIGLVVWLPRNKLPEELQ